MSSVQVTVAIVSWNTRDLLRNCLEAFAADADAGRADVWVVDNGSSDGSAELVEREFEWVSLVRPERNLGFGPAVNLVAAESGASWIAAANADIAVHPGALERLVHAGEANPDVGVVAPRLVLPSGSAQHSVYRFPTLAFAAAFNAGLYRLVPGLGDRLCLEGFWDPERARRVDWAVGAFLLVRRAAFEEVGGFAPDQWMYAEDLDLCWRLAERGWRAIYVPEAHVSHELSAATTQAWGDERTERWQEATYRWYERRRGTLAARVFALMNFAGAATRWLLLRPLATLRPARFARPVAAMRRWSRLHLAALRGYAGR